MTSLIPSPEQEAILDLGLRPVRVRAGAGTGKTTTVAMLIANLVRSHQIEPEEILGITFTNKAAAELAERVAELMPQTIDPARQAEIHTYHGFAAQVLSEFGALAGVDNRAQVITPTFTRQLMSDTFHHHTYQHLDITHGGDIDKTRRLGDRLGDHLLLPKDLVAAAPAELDETWAKRLEMAETLEVFAADKRRLRVVDYSDLVTLSTHLLQEHPELATAISDRYRVVVLDEYQDTNPAQRALLTAIFKDGFPVIAVGDEDQTIYEWRGASAENFRLFPLNFRDADGSPAQQRELRLNRRSAQEILDIANQVRRLANPDADLLEAVDPDSSAEVVTYWGRDALDEAEWIARSFEELHDTGSRWSDMAVLFRKNKDFAVVVDALARHDIPVEVANIGGLLSVPEVAELRAWLSILENPEDSPSLVQILLGSRYRLGLADLAPLTRLLAGLEVDEVEDSDEPTPVTLLEAIEMADEISDLRPEARAALQRFLAVYREALVEGQGLTLVETLRLILDRTRAWQDIEALPPTQRLTARLNVYRLLDVAEDWSPLSGRPSVRAFLDYLALMEQEPAEELDSARLSGEDAVTLVTVHRAKGLEWETVALPSLTKGNFPSRSGQFEDPIRFPEHVPVALRIDQALADLPAEDAPRADYLRERHDRQEWRVAYVAVTRAKRRLLASGAFWYGLPEPTVNPYQPSPLFELIAQSPVTRSGGRAELGPRPDLLRSPILESGPDPLFPDGWEQAVRDAMADPGRIDALAHHHGLSRPYRETVDQLESRLFAIEDIEEIPEEASDSVSVTDLVTYAQCPKRFYWSSVDPLPRRHNPAATRGTEIHRRIELHQRGVAPLEPIAEAVYDRAPDEQSGVTYDAETGFHAYLASRYAGERAALVEAPFSLEIGPGHRVRGRIDAIYARDGSWEVVDFKSGRPSDDPSRLVQLQAYAVAAGEVDFGIPGPERLDVSFAHLGSGLEVQTHHADEEWLAEARRNLDELASRIDAEDWTARPGDWCHGCDFLRFCGPGQAEVAT
ncbi:MAG: ATP-dependent helicase [Acidimicrobiia bacterium]